MHSPFPGMDPYLEQSWGDIHAQLSCRIAYLLQPVLPSDLRARVEEHVTLEIGEGAQHRVPDVRIIERPSPPVVDSNGGGVAVAELAKPLVLEAPPMMRDDPVPHYSIEIRETRSGNRVVTVLEVLSLANKRPGPNRAAYLVKQNELKYSNVNLVEIDLLRSGQTLMPVPIEALPKKHQTPYRVCVYRTGQATALEYYRVSLRERLPAIAVPLRDEDHDVPLDLQAAFEYCYQAGAYNDTDYSIDADPPLEGADAPWADRLLRAKKLRGEPARTDR